MTYPSQATRQEVVSLVGRSILTFGSEGHECDVPCALDGCAELALVSGTIAGDPSRNNFPPLSDQVTQAFDIFIVDISNLVRAEAADFFSWKASFCRHSLMASFVLSAPLCRIVKCATGAWPFLERYVVIVH